MATDLQAIVHSTAVAAAAVPGLPATAVLTVAVAAATVVEAVAGSEAAAGEEEEADDDETCLNLKPIW